MSFAYPGVYTTKKKDGTTYFRSSITYRNKHISLGSFSNPEDANQAYIEATLLIANPIIGIENYSKSYHLTFDKWICLINFRDNHIYFSNPIYVKAKYFCYYLSKNDELIFDIDDLFYYSSHKIMRRNGHLFVADYGMQVNILGRYGISNYSVKGIDYQFVNGNSHDYRYENIKIINKYFGVHKIIKNGSIFFRTRIHLNGYFIVGYYISETEAAIAYNKAADILLSKGIKKNYAQNYIDSITNATYAAIYTNLKISDKIVNFTLNHNL